MSLAVKDELTREQQRALAGELVSEIGRLAELAGRHLRFMEVCGTHTVSIFRAGLRQMLPENVEPDRDEKGQIYYIYHAYTDEVPGEQNKDIYFRRDEIFHIPASAHQSITRATCPCGVALSARIMQGKSVP